ncbi:chaperonin 10-like protein [Aspergillus crustosus]
MIPKTMKALRLVKYNTPYELQEIPVPEYGPNDLLLKTGAASFCHTDYQVYEGVYQSSLPLTPSHEPVGTIVAVGKKAASAGWKVGQRVGMLNIRHACGSCVGCRVARDPKRPERPDGRFCEEKEMAGVTGDGGLAEYVIADAEYTVLLPEGLEFEQAAPLMCAGVTVWGGIDQASLKPGLPVGVIGIGGLGVLAIQFLVALGHPVVAIDNRVEGRQLAREVPEHLSPGLIVDYNSPNAIEEITDFAGDGGLAAVLVCTDSVTATEWSLKLLRAKGVCVPLGLPTEGFKFSAFDLILKQLSIRGSLLANQRMAEDMMKVVREKGVRSHVAPMVLEEAVDLPERYMNQHLKGRLVVTM